MSVYLFDLVHLPHFQYEYTEEEFKKDCPEWVGKNWAFVKQMATGFTHVCLYSHKWFVYSRDNDTFRVTETPTLAREAIVMSPFLTHESRNEIKHLFDAVGSY